MTVQIIAEVGSVHDGSFGNALHLVDLAAACGVDAVKFQTHIAAAETLRDAPQPPYFKGEPRYQYFERTSFTPSQWAELKTRAAEQGLAFLSSPFSSAAVALLESLEIEQYKIPSGEITNLPLLEDVARTGKPVLLSSGMSNWEELDAAVATIRKHHTKITVMQCTSEYPCRYEHVGLNVLEEMRRRFELPVGLSDHTLTNYAAFSAVTLGASVVEKHLTFSRSMYGSDAKHSLEPNEFSDLVQGIRAIEVMLGSQVSKDNLDGFRNMKQIFEKSVTACVRIPAGTIIQASMLTPRKPGTGIPASRINDVIGRRTAGDIEANSLVQWSDITETKSKQVA